MPSHSVHRHRQGGEAAATVHPQTRRRRRCLDTGAMTSGCQMSRMILTSRQTSAVPWDKGASWTGGHQQRLDVWCCLFVEEVPRCAMSPAVRVGAGARDASRNGGARLERESGTAPSDNGSPLSVVRSPTVTRRTGSHYKRPSMCRVDSMELWTNQQRRADRRGATVAVSDTNGEW